MNILAIDTSNQVLGIAILSHNKIIGEMITNVKKNQTSRLMPGIHQLMNDVGMKPDQLNKIVVAKGPGSYTGVRIGVTTAKSLAWALSIPVVGVSSLEVLAYQGLFYNGFICPFFDARRQRVYTGLYQGENNHLIQVHEEINISMDDWLESVKVYDQDIMFLSPNIALYKPMIVEQMGNRAIFPKDIFHMAKPSNLAVIGLNKQADDTHSLIPNYLRLAEAEANWLQEQKDNQIYG